MPARVRIAESGQRARPVGLPAIAPRRVGGGGFAVPHQPRAEAAADDTTGQRGELPVVLGGDFADNHAMILAAGREQ
jgi:hypothetical protein